ncbi:hypothetical protein, partial [Streptococcus pseudopneumoniae]|uniref:hypothetical protein n=1 Tax=Streptococcus pseudopneumoniae TaxID=257758 RepID=UPI0019D502CC
NLIIRLNAVCKNRSEAEVAADLSTQLTERLKPVEWPMKAPAEVIDFTGKRGRHPAACICATCAKKAELVNG